jgi:hypothetical protein
MTVYLDNDYKCHVSGEGMRAYEADFFDGKCNTFIEGYRIVPEDEQWMREDGVVFRGLMIAPWKDYAILAAAQQGYEESLAELADAKAALATLGVTDNE